MIYIPNSNSSLTLVHYHTCFRHHRKPYLTIGALVFSAAFLSYALSSIDHIVWLAVCVFVGTMGLICMDVMADTMCVERAKFESEEIRGHMQASCYSIRFGGSLLGAILGTTPINTTHSNKHALSRQTICNFICIPFPYTLSTHPLLDVLCVNPFSPHSLYWVRYVLLGATVSN